MKTEDLKTGISSSNISADFLFRLVKNGITEYEMSVGNLADARIIDWKTLKKNSDAAGLHLWSYHLPFYPPADISDTDNARRMLAVDALSELVKRSASVGIKHVIIHPSFEPIADSERELKTECSKSSLATLSRICESEGSVLCVENLPRTCLGRDEKDMLSLLSADEKLRVCFDVNHLLLSSGCDHEKFVRAVGEKIVTAHMSDYDFIDEKHMFCGNGLINWNKLADLLEGCNYSGPFLFEGGFAPNPRCPDVPLGTVEEARSRHLSIRNYRGNG